MFVGLCVCVRACMRLCVRLCVGLCVIARSRCLAALAISGLLLSLQLQSNNQPNKEKLYEESIKVCCIDCRACCCCCSCTGCCSTYLTPPSLWPNGLLLLLLCSLADPSTRSGPHAAISQLPRGGHTHFCSANFAPFLPLVCLFQSTISLLFVLV